MASPSRKRATHDDLLAVPEDKVAEIVDGDLYASPRPGTAHSVSGSALTLALGGVSQLGRGGPGGWWILFEPDVHLEGDVLAPDLAGWRLERLARPPSAAAIDLAPNWVCEIVSPSTEPLDRARKLPAYARHAVSHAWLINPAARTLEVLRLEAGRWVLLASFAGDELARAEPFESVEVDLLLLWGETREADSGEVV